MEPDDDPKVIDGGARYIARETAPDWPTATATLADMLARCPADAYPLRVSMQKSDRGARVHLTVVHQRRGAPLPGEARDVRGSERDRPGSERP